MKESEFYTEQAFAKINLFLNVLSERADGYHELDTLFYPVPALFDDISLTFAGEPDAVVLECDHPRVPLEPEKNLCGKAVYAYCKTSGLPVPGCRIRIVKRIPCAGGMGGGSSDAAAVLRILQSRFHAVTDSELAQIALSLGADVPFFLDQKCPARAGGVGEKLIPVMNLPERLPFLIAASDFPIPAKWAYQHWTPELALPRDHAEKLVEALQQNDLVSAALYMGNSLEAPALKKFPLLVLLKERLASTGAVKVMLSGSGPTLFALYPDFAAMNRAYETLLHQPDFAAQLVHT